MEELRELLTSYLNQISNNRSALKTSKTIKQSAKNYTFKLHTEPSMLANPLLTDPSITCIDSLIYQRSLYILRRKQEMHEKEIELTFSRFKEKESNLVDICYFLTIGEELLKNCNVLFVEKSDVFPADHNPGFVS